MPAKRSPPGPAGPVSFGDRIEGLLAFDGRKRGLVTDTIGLPVAVDVHPANIQDRDGAVPLLTSMRSSWPWLRHVFADGGFAGDKLVNALVGKGKWTIEIVRRSAEAEGFEVLPRRLRGLLAASLSGIGSRASWPLMDRAAAGSQAHARRHRRPSRACWPCLLRRSDEWPAGHSWTTWPRTRSRACASRSRPRAPSSAISRPVRPTSTHRTSADRGGRKRLRQAGGTAQNGRRAHHRGPLDHDRQAAPPLLASRMPELRSAGKGLSCACPAHSGDKEAPVSRWPTAYTNPSNF